MKRNAILISTMVFVLTLLAVASVDAQTWHTANQVTFAWDPSPIPECTCPTPPCSVTEQCPGPAWPSPAAGEMKYQVYSRNDATSSGVKVGGEITATELAITFPTWGKYYLGVEAVFYLAGKTEPIKSTRSWSNDPAVTESGQAFGVDYLPQVAAPKGLRLK